MDSLVSMINILHNSAEFIVLDIETTGLSYRYGDRITEICCYKVVNNSSIDIFSTLMNPDREIPDKIVRLNGITNEMVRLAPRVGDIAGNLLKFIGNTPIVCHNVKFDIDNFIKPLLLDKFSYSLDNKTICTLELSRLLIKKLKSHKLSNVYEYLTGNKAKNSHRALGDVGMTTEVLLKLKAFVDSNYDKIVY